MNNKSKFYAITLSYLLIPTITVVVITMGDYRKAFSHNIIDTSVLDMSRHEILASVAELNAEANLPIYDTPEVRNNINKLAVYNTQPQVTDYSSLSVSGTYKPKSSYKSNDGIDKGSWCINIASLANRDKANKYVEYAKIKGIDAKQAQVTVKGRKYWRVSVKGFLTLDEAESYAIFAKDRLGLKEVWVSKESDQSS